MSRMFCFQCQEAAKNIGCTVRGVCGKTEDVSNLQDLLIFALKGLSVYALKAREAGVSAKEADRRVIEGLFATITNANFDRRYFIDAIRGAIAERESLKKALGGSMATLSDDERDAATWTFREEAQLDKKAADVGFLVERDEDIRSLKALILFGLKGMAAYTEHAEVLGFSDPKIHTFIQKALAATLSTRLSAEDLVALTLETGEYGVAAMSLLDRANTTTYGHPQITKVNIGVRKNPGILISGHDLKDLEELLEQTQGTGVDVYTHGEMLPAQYYPAFKKYDHFAGNYGSAWWKQDKEFESFNGPILMTTNCLVPPKDSYKDRVTVTGVVGFPGLKSIPAREPGKKKDFSALIAQAKTCKPPKEIETGEIVGGFAHETVFALADQVIAAIKEGHIKKFVVMAGCDGRMKSREYYTEFAEKLPKDTVILTAGCAKYRYNKLPLGTIGQIPRVLDAGQCNDSYSLALIALKLKEAFGFESINQLPIVYNIAWYEQKAVIVLLALLYLGVKNIHLGPTLPAFLSPGVTNVLVEKFGISGITDADADLKAFL
ncbi:MAG: Hydroxylamine reductase [Thermotogae bacterium ADurb.Bin062]|nr:MAG: Hydroxylamine reductase [Thermotogota bacterium ADurb.Bin062]